MNGKSEIAWPAAAAFHSHIPSLVSDSTVACRLLRLGEREIGGGGEREREIAPAGQLVGWPETGFFFLLGNGKNKYRCHSIFAVAFSTMQRSGPARPLLYFSTARGASEGQASAPIAALEHELAHGKG